MSPDERWFPSHLKEMDKAECLELLASHRSAEWPTAMTWVRSSSR